MTQRIPLDKGMFAIVDDDRYTLVMRFKWHAAKSRHSHIWYARTNYRRPDGKHTLLDMHRYIMNASPGQIIDHCNGDGLDNRDDNLRICTHRDNMRNRRSHGSDKTSRYAGVSAVEQARGRVLVAQMSDTGQLSRNGTPRKFIGVFMDEDMAARAYDEVAIKMYGTFANTNFPRSDYE
jgi:hypothetical protein